MNNYWINLPVQDIDRTIAFYTGIGLSLGSRAGDGNSASIMAGSQAMMFFERSVLEQNIGRSLEPVNEMIVSFSMSSNEEVDALAENIEKSGGKLLSPPKMEQGYYGLLFADPDDHLLNVIVM